MIPRCFWNLVCITLLLLLLLLFLLLLLLLLLNTRGGCDTALDFPPKITSCAFFLGSGLKLVFYWNGHLFIFAKLLFSSRAEVILSWIRENKDISSAKSLAFEDNPSDESLIYIKNKNGPSMEIWGAPPLISDQSETCPFNKTLCFLFLRKSHKRFSKLSDIPFCVDLKIRPLHQTLSNAFDISRKIPLTSNTSSNDLYISWAIAKSWFMHESQGLNPNWIGEMNSFSIKNLKISLKINFSKIFSQIGRRDIGDRFLNIVCHLFYELEPHSPLSIPKEKNHFSKLVGR